ncbi:DNA/RNA non-specific endonuclease [Sinorhizobium medicae]|uniref:DNA/RNA non-specific endonuclease n=1 Tax=Sinorhizobium medicae TaxID=110321 RepID=UPI001F48C038|nr:DNA/RNA non-specific endonuclease [Sinorhizobium medicae]UWU12438.1 DNA/RNA non-specific endonuclease [Sinorhizobium medicae]
MVLLGILEIFGLGQRSHCIRIDQGVDRRVGGLEPAQAKINTHNDCQGGHGSDDDREEEGDHSDREALQKPSRDCRGNNRKPEQTKNRPEKLEQSPESKRQHEAEIKAGRPFGGKTWEWFGVQQRRQVGIESQMGAEDTFHYTNAAPQVQTYNDIDWGNLEDYLLDKAQSTDKRLTIFTGPIFRENDPLYGKDRKGGPWKIPLSFWKIAVLQKSPAKVAAAAFIVGQTQYVQALYEAKVFSGLKSYTVDQMRKRRIQTTIAAIEEESGLNFSAVRQFDAQGTLESTRQTRWISDINDVVI